MNETTLLQFIFVWQKLFQSMEKWSLGSDEHIFRRRQIRLRLLGRGFSQHLSER